MKRKYERHHAIRDHAVAALQADYAKSRAVPNPYRRGCYWSIIEALKALGANRYHPYAALRQQVQNVMGEERWQKYVHRDRDWARIMFISDPVADADRRLQCNCRVLQRTRDYGLKLLQVGQMIMGTKGCVIDIDTRNGCQRLRLNKNSSAPRRARHGTH
jgi:hypothetical protein